MYKNIAEQFGYVWKFFTGRYIPVLNNELYQNMPPLAKVMIPFVGFGLGLCMVLPLFVQGLFGRIPQTVLAGIQLPFVLEYLVSWKSISALTAYIECRRNGADQDEALQEYDGNTEKMLQSSPHFTMILVLNYLLRGVFFAALTYCGAGFWIIVSLVAAYLVRAELCSVKVGGSDRDFIPADEKLNRWHWYLAAGLMFLVSLGSYTHLLGVIVALLVCYGISWYATHLCLMTNDGMNCKSLQVFGTASELLILFCGLLFYTA